MFSGLNMKKYCCHFIVDLYHCYPAVITMYFIMIMSVHSVSVFGRNICVTLLSVADLIPKKAPEMNKNSKCF